jgi:hypothetical protein
MVCKDSEVRKISMTKVLIRGFELNINEFGGYSSNAVWFVRVNKIF